LVSVTGAGDDVFVLARFAELWNMAASSVRVSVVDCRSGGRSGSVFLDWRAWRRSSAAASIKLSRDAVGMRKLWGCHFTVSHILVELVDGVHILWHR